MSSLTRRHLLGGAALRAVQAPAPMALVPRVDLVNVPEYELQAARRLTAATQARIAGGDRAAFERMTLRPRMMVPAVDLDLSLTLFGDTHFAPILVGPVANQREFHADAEQATVKGAAAAKAAVVISSQSSIPLEALAPSAATPLWFQVFASEEGAAGKVEYAVKAGCRVVCVTVGASPVAGGRVTTSAAARDWEAVAALVRASSVPVVVKGVSSADAATRAIETGARGVVVSNYGGLVGSEKGAAVAALATVYKAVAGKAPIFIDGSLRRGTDILKALALGATAVFVARPVMWGLAAYGAEGVQSVIEMLQTELGRYMAMTGAPTLKMINAGMVKIHGAGPAGILK